MVVGLRWSFFALALMMVVLAAYMFRYEPLTPYMNDIEHPTFVWDRWGNRTCITDWKLGNQMICSRKEMDEFLQKLEGLGR